MSVTISSSANHLPLANATNSVGSKRRSKSHHSKARFPLAIPTRKAGPTCTVSLAVVSAHKSLRDGPSSNSVPFPSSACAEVNMPQQVDIAIPFPASPDCESFQTVSVCSPPPSPPSHVPRSGANERRRQRSNACVSAPVPLDKAKPRSRKRTSSGKGKKSKPHPSIDIQFVQLLQRSVAWRLAERGLFCPESNEDGSQRDEDDELEVQDMVLVHRLREFLVSQGCKPWRSHPLPIPPTAAAASGSCLDASSDPVTSTLGPDSSPTPNPSPGTLDPCSHSPPPLIYLPQPQSTSLKEEAALADQGSPGASLLPPAVLSLPTLVASLILRHRERSTLRRQLRSRQASPYPRPPSRSGCVAVDGLIDEERACGDAKMLHQNNYGRSSSGTSPSRGVVSPLALCVSVVETEADNEMDVDLA